MDFDISSLAQSTVSKIAVETAWLPRIEINDPFAKSTKPASPADASVNHFLKPRFLIYSRYSSVPLDIAPYGIPHQNWPLVKWLLIGLGGLAALNIVAPRVARRIHG